MYLRRLTNWMLKSRIQSIGAAIVLTLLPFGATLSILLAGLVTLCKGSYEGGWVTLAATLPLLAYVYFAGIAPSTLVVGALLIVIISNITMWGTAVLLRSYGNWNFLLEWIAVIGGVLIVGVHLFYPKVQQWWLAQLTDYFNKNAHYYMGLQPTAMQQASLLRSLDKVKNCATGLLACAVIGNTLLQLWIVRGWQNALYATRRAAGEWGRLRMGYVAGVLFGLSSILSLLGNATALDMLPVFYLAFGLAGLSLLHYSLQRSVWPRMGLGLLYGVVIGLLPKSFMLMAWLGLIDTIFNLRNLYFKQRGI